MNASTITAAVLLALAVAIAVLFSFGMAMMRDALQRLHFTTPVAIFSTILIVAAICIVGPDAQARIKAVLIAITLITTNTILNHVNARAFRIRAVGHWPPKPEEGIPIIGREDHP
jgi:multisubunit Na+/H+ antiporter MnhG subunit